MAIGGQLKLFEENYPVFNFISEYDYKINFTPSLLKRVKPQNRGDLIEKSIDYIWEVALLFRIIKTQIDFTALGFKMVHEDEKIEQFYKSVYENLDMEEFIKNIAFYLYSIGEWYPFYSWKSNTPINATLLDPRLIEVENIFGKDFIYMRPSREMLNLLARNDEVAKKIREIIPQKYLKEWERGNSVYLEGTKRYYDLKEYCQKYTVPPISVIFGDLEILKTLQEADYAVAQKLRQLILHIKIGSKDFNNGQPVNKKIIDDAKVEFNDPSRSMEVFSQYFVDMKYIFPPLEIFNKEKYGSVIERILQWSGIQTIISTENGSYSEGYIKIKGLKQIIENGREKIKKTLDDFNKEIARKNGLLYYGKEKIPKIIFNKNALEDPKIVQEIVKYLYGTGVLSIESLEEYGGYDYKVELERKEKENEKYRDKHIVEPLFEPNQGLLSEEEGSENSGKLDKNGQPRITR
jgi:hypothetical protein